MGRCRLSPVYRLVTWTQKRIIITTTRDLIYERHISRLFFSYKEKLFSRVCSPCSRRKRLINIAVRHMYYMYRCWVGEWPVRSLRCPPKLLGGINVIRWRRRKREKRASNSSRDGIDIKEEERWKEKKSRKKETAVGYVKREACNNRRTANHSRHKLMATRSSLSPFFLSDRRVHLFSSTFLPSFW